MMAADLAGDVPLRLDDYRYSSAEARFLARIGSAQHIHNYQNRAGQAAGIGRRHLSGWRYSLVCALRLRVLADLATCAGFGMPQAAQVAALAGRIALESSRRNRRGELVDSTAGFAPNRTILIAYSLDGAPLVTVADIAQPGHYYPPPAPADGADEPLRRMHLCFPVTAMLHDVVLRTAELERRQAEAAAG